MPNLGITFSREFIGNDPLAHIGVKLPVYLRFLDLILAEGWGAFVLTKKTYQGTGIFKGVWGYKNGKFERLNKPVKIDLVYDRSAGVKFPPEKDESLIWVNRRDFKILAWDKWAAYQKIGEYMPKTCLLNSENEIPDVLTKIKTDWVVLKPFNGLKGIGVFVGSKKDALDFKFKGKYIAQEFVDTSRGIVGITPGLHDLRLAMVNNEIVWTHVRVPKDNDFRSNAAAGGTLTEVNLKSIPAEIKKIAESISDVFSKKYDNPIYSLDFGIGTDGVPKIFEINDQIGFPKWEMQNRDNFLEALIRNFKSKLI